MTLTEDVPSRPITRYRSSAIETSLVITEGDCRTAGAQVRGTDGRR
jgi:hypothetical protein